MAEEKKLTREELLEYRARWERVNRFQIEEARRTPLEERLGQLNVLFRLAQSMKLNRSIDDPEILAVRARWRRIKTKP